MSTFDVGGVITNRVRERKLRWRRVPQAARYRKTLGRAAGRVQACVGFTKDELRAIDDAAERMEMSRSALIARATMRYIGRRGF